MKPQVIDPRNIAVAAMMAFTAADQAMAGPPPPTLTFSISGVGITANGTFTYSPINLASYGTVPGYGPAWRIDGVSGTFNDSISGISGSFAGVIPASMDYTSIPRPHDYPTSGDPANHGSIGKNPGPYDISYDNIIYPGGDSPNVCPNYYNYGGGPLDLFGLLLEVNKTGGGSALVNIWSNGNLNDPSNPLGLDYGIAIGNYVPLDAKPFQQLRYIGDGNDYQTNPLLYSGSGVTFTVVPEPSTYAMMAGAALVGFSIWRKTRRA